MDDARETQLAAVAALAEPTRRRLYEFVVRRPAPVSRDEAAAALGLARTTAAFHLDRLVEEGLLDVGFERRTGRAGPGAGRPSKLYRRSECQVAVTVPERRYDLAGELLAAALAEAERSGAAPREVLAGQAYRRGRALAAGDLVEVLEAQGFAPVGDDGGVLLTNCPFLALAREHAALVCGMNLRLLEGLVDGMPRAGLRARLDPGPGRCCVRLVREAA